VSSEAPVRPDRDQSSRPVSVGFLCSEYPSFQSEHGGIGSFVQTLARALVESGHRATVFGFGDRDEDSTDAGVQLRLMRRRGGLSSVRMMQSRLHRALIADEIDVAESAESEAHCLPGGRRTIVRFHGSHHFWCATLGQPKRYGRLLLEQIAVRRAWGLCAVSQFAADVTRHSMGLGARPIEVLSNPVDTAVFAPRPGTIVDGSILFVGSIMEKKGVRALCASMEHVLRRHPEARLSLAGRDIAGPHGEGTLREDIGRGLSDQVRTSIRFLGARRRGEVSALMASAQVCVFPSRMETQGLVILEAMACGRPVVVTSRGPGPEVLGSNGDCGLLVDPMDPIDIADKLCRILDDGTGADRMGEHGRQRVVEHFSVPICLARNVTFYRRQLRHGSHGH
jgi:glycosyltransferase involved in cell wall biosynthesis